MAAHLDIDNICDVLVFGLEYPIPELAEKAHEFLIYNLDDISQTEKFSQMDASFVENFFSNDNLILYNNRYRRTAWSSQKREELILNCVLRYLSKAEVNKPDIIKNMIQTVRLPQISEDVIQNCMKNFKKLNNNEVIKKHLKLRKVALKYLKGSSNDPLVIKKAHEIPCSWLMKRSWGTVHIYTGKRYAAGGEIEHTPHSPTVMYNSPNIQIKRIEIWLRTWKNRVVIGGMKLFYRSTSEEDVSLPYVRGHCPEGKVDHVVELEPDELIIKVVVGSGFLIDRLGFETNKGRVLGPFGGPGGSEYIESITPDDELSYLLDINYQTVITYRTGAIFNLMLRWISLS
jgi:hypothetical protein